jgi:hypothetical protein
MDQSVLGAIIRLTATWVAYEVDRCRALVALKRLLHGIRLVLVMYVRAYVNRVVKRVTSAE